MGDMDNYIKCPNCGNIVPRGTVVCPNCGWQYQPSVWPPPIPQQPYQAPLSGAAMVFQAIAGFVGGVASTMVPSVLMCAGLVVGPLLYRGLKDKESMYARGFLAGMIVGALGVLTCAGGMYKL